MRPAVRVALLAWICTLGGGALVAWALFNLDQGRASRHWPTAEGTIRSSRVVEVRSLSRSTGSPTLRYHPEVVFAYRVDGVRYVGHRISFRDDHFGRRPPAERIAARYPRGATVPVSYDPDDPEQAVLEPVYDWSTYIPLAIGLFFVAGGFYLLRQERRLSQKRPPIDGEPPTGSPGG